MQKPPKVTQWAVRFNYLRLCPPNEKGFQKSYILDKDMLMRKLKHAKVNHAVFQLEAGKNHTLHWQLYVCFAKPVNKYAVKYSLGLIAGEYWAPCISADAYAGYCVKDATRVEGPYHYPSEDIDQYLNALLDNVKMI